MVNVSVSSCRLCANFVSQNWHAICKINQHCCADFVAQLCKCCTCVLHALVFFILFSIKRNF